MTAINWPAVQTRLGLNPNGRADAFTYAALLGRVAGHRITPDLAAPFATHLPQYDVDANVSRLSAFIGQCCHESLRFTRTREIWGPTAWQKKYEGRADLGNTQKGDGFNFRGAGWIEVTGRDWFTRIGKLLGIDLAGNPDLANAPEIATLMSLAWWKLNGMNAIADTGDIRAVTHKINPGMLGLDERTGFTIACRALLV